PLWRHARCLDLAVIENPASLATLDPAAALQRPPTALPVIAVAELVGADQLAPEPGVKASAEAAHAWGDSVSSRTPAHRVAASQGFSTKNRRDYGIRPRLRPALGPFSGCAGPA